MKRYIAFNRRAATKQRDMLRKMRLRVREYKAMLRKLPDMQSLMALPPDEKLIEGFASALTQVEVAAYVDGRTSARRRARSRKANSIMAFSDFDVDKWLSEHVGFDWDLAGVEAIQAMAAEAVDYSAANISNLLDFIKDDAIAAIDKGLSFLDWKDNILSLPGWEDANPYHLRTNFDTAANGAYHAAKWHEITEYADLFPYLRYVTMQDDKVREEHAILNGTIARVEDPFWTIYYPPNGYNCRCSVEQLMRSEAEQDPKFGVEMLTPQFDPRFQKNTGQTNKIFT